VPSWPGSLTLLLLLLLLLLLPPLRRCRCRWLGIDLGCGDCRYGLVQAEEAIARAEADPHAPFIAEQMAALGLQAEHSQALLQSHANGGGSGSDSASGMHHININMRGAGVAPGVWAKTALEMDAVKGDASKLVAIAMERTEGLAAAL